MACKIAAEPRETGKETSLPPRERPGPLFRRAVLRESHDVVTRSSNGTAIGSEHQFGGQGREVVSK